MLLSVDLVQLSTLLGVIFSGIVGIIAALKGVSTGNKVNVVADKQDTAAIQTAEIHAATNGNLAELKTHVARLEEQLTASVATVADRDTTLAASNQSKETPNG